jgi:hypothetical protein
METTQADENGIENDCTFTFAGSLCLLGRIVVIGLWLDRLNLNSRP